MVNLGNTYLTINWDKTPNENWFTGRYSQDKFFGLKMTLLLLQDAVEVYEYKSR